MIQINKMYQEQLANLLEFWIWSLDDFEKIFIQLVNGSIEFFKRFLKVGDKINLDLEEQQRILMQEFIIEETENSQSVVGLDFHKPPNLAM